MDTKEGIICPFNQGDCYDSWRGCDDCSIKWDADLHKLLDDIDPDEPLGLGV